MVNTTGKILIELPELYISLNTHHVDSITDGKAVSSIPGNDSFIEGAIIHRGETLVLASIIWLFDKKTETNQNKILIMKNKGKKLAIAAGPLPITFVESNEINGQPESSEAGGLLIKAGTYKKKPVKELNWQSIYEKSLIALAPKKAKYSVLLVDDEVFFRNTIKGLLKGSDYLVIGEAENGEEGVKLAKELKPDIVIMDIMMPKKNGIVATQEIKDLKLPSRVIMCSSTIEGNTIDMAFDSGAKNFIEKPIDEKNFIRSIDKVVKI